MIPLFDTGMSGERETVIKVTTLPVILRKRPVPLNLHFISATTVKNQLLACRFGRVLPLA